jgi:hypothetical protein
MAYVFTFWTFYVLYHEYKVVTTMRLRFLANQNRRPDQYTVRCILRTSLTNGFEYSSDLMLTLHGSTLVPLELFLAQT